MLPMMPAGMPGFRVSSFQVRPPSVVLKIPLPGPPLTSSHGFRYGLPDPGIEHLGIGGIHRQVDRAGASRSGTDLVPGLAAVGAS